MELSNIANLSPVRQNKCVECMCLMTLFQEHISSKHSGSSSPYFELSEWQQAGYKQMIKWTLECDRCEFKTTSKADMFEHIANHQVLENTVQRINQSAASQPSRSQLYKKKPRKRAHPIQRPIHRTVPYKTVPQMPALHMPHSRMSAPPSLSPPTSSSNISTPHISTPHISTPHSYDPSQLANHPELMVASDGATGDVAEVTATVHEKRLDEEEDEVIVKDELTDPGTILIHLAEEDISEMNRTKPPPPLPTLPPPTANQLNGTALQMYSRERQFQTLSANPTTSDSSNNFKCTWCEFAGPTPDSLMYHTRLEHKMFNCSSCEYVGSKPADLEIHMSEFHDSMLCIYCGVNCGTARALRRHYSLDHGTKMKKCKQCNYTTANKTQLTHHINSEHYRRKPRSCNFCDYVAYAENHMRQHVLAIHEKQKPFCCPQCPMKFGRKFQVKEHLKRRHNIEMTPSLSESLNIGYKIARGEVLPEADLPDATLSTEEQIMADIPVGKLASC